MNTSKWKGKDKEYRHYIKTSNLNDKPNDRTKKNTSRYKEQATII